MSYAIHDPDEWVWVPGKSEITGTFPGTNVPFGWVTSGHLERRDPAEVSRIRAERERAREEAVLAEADLIRARRAVGDRGDLETILGEIRRVYPISSSTAELRPRVMAMFKLPEVQDVHQHLLAQVVAYAVQLGTEQSDVEAGYQTVLALQSDVLATLQAISRRVNKKPAGDAAPALALVAYDTADRVHRERAALIGRFVKEFHPWAAADETPAPDSRVQGSGEAAP